MPVNVACQEYIDNLDRWSLVKDAVKGEDAIKSGRDKYLPFFVPHDEPRYKAYIQRAVYTNYTGRTLNGLVGAIFRKPPVFDLPTVIEYIEEDFDGSGQSLDQLGRIVCEDLLSTGRIGLLIDYPPTPEGLTKEQTDNFQLRATIATYPAESIINWRAVNVGGKLILDMVVLKETVYIPKDEFTVKADTQYRVLTFDENRIYIQRIFDKDGTPKQKDIYPKMAGNKPWREIPFIFCGSSNNRPEIDEASLYDLACVNIAHYRNSADYEEAAHMHGQGTLFINPGEMSADTFASLNPNGITVGARRGHVLGNGGSAALLQMQANSAAFEAMQNKVEAMKGIGARIAGLQTKVQETAEAVRINASSETSVLKTLTGNAAEGIEKALEYACLFMGGDPKQVHFTLNKDFFDQDMTPQEALVWLQLVDRADVSQADLRGRLRTTGWLEADRTDEDIDASIKDEETSGSGLKNKKVILNPEIKVDPKTGLPINNQASQG